MLCCDPMFDYTEKELAELLVGACPDCGSDIDKDGDSIENDNCSYSPVICELCGWRPCDGSC